MKNRNLIHSDNWETPSYIYDELNKEFDFDFDPCPINHDISKWDGLKVEWGNRNFINPPYSRKLKEAFVKKAIEKVKKVSCAFYFYLYQQVQYYSTIIFYQIKKR